MEFSKGSQVFIYVLFTPCVQTRVECHSKLIMVIQWNINSAAMINIFVLQEHNGYIILFSNMPGTRNIAMFIYHSFIPLNIQREKYGGSPYNFATNTQNFRHCRLDINFHSATLPYLQFVTCVNNAAQSRFGRTKYNYTQLIWRRPAV